MEKEVVLNGKGGCFGWKRRLFWVGKEVVYLISCGIQIWGRHIKEVVLDEVDKGRHRHFKCVDFIEKYSFMDWRYEWLHTGKKIHDLKKGTI